jgi:putative membrane protein
MAMKSNKDTNSLKQTMRVVMVAALLGTMWQSTASAQYNSSNSQNNPNTASNSTAPTESSMTDTEPNASGASLVGQDMVDKAFVISTFQRGLLSIQLGQIAMTKSSDAQIKKIAHMIVNDRTRLNAAFSNVAQAMEILLPDSPTKKQTEQITRLQALDEPTFDKEFMKVILDAQKDTDEAFQREADHAADADLKSMATQVSPVLHRHREYLENLAQNSTVAQK